MSFPGASYRSFNKLKRPEDYQNVFSSEQRFADKHFLFVLRNNNLGYARLGIAVPKRCIQRSVKRNRVKRVIRESFRYRQEQLSGLDLMVLVRKPIRDLNKKGFDLVLDKHWEKICKCKQSC